MPEIPPWLNVTPQSFLAASSAGGQAGLEAAGMNQRGRIAAAAQAADAQRLALAAQAQQQSYQMQQAQLQQHATIAQMEMQARQDIAEKAQAREAQKIALDNAYRQEMIGVHQANLERQNIIAKERMRQAAMGFMAQQGFARDISGGATVAQALQNNPQTPATYITALSDKSPASVKLIDEIMNTDRQAEQALREGRTADASSFKQRSELLREQAKGPETSLTFDDQGRITAFRQGKGNAPTVATSSAVQKKLMKYEGAVELMNSLEGALKPGHVGLQGIVGEYLADRGLGISQWLPVNADPQRITSRTMIIGLREGLLREMSDDTRFSNADRESISKALPSDGAFESVPRAIGAMNEVRRILSSRGKIAARAVGVGAPLWTLSAQEIIDDYKAGKIKREDAEDALKRFHPD